MAGKENHQLRLIPFFLALSALTAGEIILYEIWRRTGFLPKHVIVIVILLLTLPKAAIVLVYFMHLKFEKLFLVVVALFPLILVFIAVLTPLTDIKKVNIRTTDGHRVIPAIDKSSDPPPKDSSSP